MAELENPDRTIAFQGLPGAYSDLACRRVFPDMTTLPCAGFEDAFAAVRDGAAAARDDPDRELGRRPGRRHPPSDARFGPLHHRRAFRAGEPPSAGAARRDVSTASAPCAAMSRRCRSAATSCGRAASQPVVRADTAGSAAEIKELRRPLGRRDRLRAGRRDLRPRIAGARTSRTPSTIRPAS